MKTTRARRNLIADAVNAGYRVEETDGCCRIWTGKTSRSLGISIWPDGTATRCDIDLAYTTTIRTVREMRQLLNLSQERRPTDEEVRLVNSGHGEHLI